MLSRAWRISRGTGQFATRNEERPTTRFEARGVRLGHHVWDLAYRKRELR